MKTFVHKKDSLNNLPLENLFNSFLMKNLPYLFWMYELIDGEYRLIKWNKNQEIFTEWSAEEIYFKTPWEFLDKKDHNKVKNAIAEVFIKGRASVNASLLTKSGKLIPHYFEGYNFNYENRQIFAGISVDITEFSDLKQKLNSTEIEKEKLFNENIKTKEQLLNFTAQILQNSRIMNILDHHVKLIMKSDDINFIKNEVTLLKKYIQIQQDSQENWELYRTKFDEFHYDFLRRLKLLHPELTKEELRFCAYLKMQTPVSEIASILNITMEGIKKKKYRIKKKLDLSRNDSLEFYILRIS